MVVAIVDATVLNKPNTGGWLELIDLPEIQLHTLWILFRFAE